MTVTGRLAVGIVLAALAGATLVWQESTLAHLRVANRTLAADAGELETLRAQREQLAEQARLEEEHSRSSRDRFELQQLRAEVKSLRGRTPTTPVARPTGTATAAPRRGPGAVINFQDTQDVGTATGEDLLQTFVWAMRTGNVTRMRELGDWSTDGAQDFAEQLAAESSKLSTSSELQRETAGMSIRVLRQVPLDDGDMAIVTETQHGTDNHRSAQRIRRAGNGWRLVMGPNGPEEVQLEAESSGD